jgi:protein-tyrosine phosphatase
VRSPGALLPYDAHMVDEQSAGSGAPERPLPETYWIAPGRLLVGEYPGSASRAAAMDRVRRFMVAGVTCFVDLTEPGELPPYEPLLPVVSPAGRTVAYRREPIPDHGVPSSREAMRQVIATIDDALADGHVVYVHCRAGVGRSALVAGCWLAERHGDAARASRELQDCWRQSARSAVWASVPETREQVGFLAGWSAPRTRPVPRPRHVDPAGRVLGAYYGLAAGDAAGDARERGVPDTGRWSQHTSLALCLAASLVERRNCDARDQMERYLRWQRDGECSANGKPGDPTPDVARALATYRWRGLPMAGTHDPRDRGTSSLPRVLAAVAWAGEDVALGVHLAAECSRTTHQSPVVLDACRYWAALLAGALGGAGPALLEVDPYEPVPGLWGARPIRPGVLAQLRGKRRGAAPTQAVDAVEAIRRVRAAVVAAADVDDAIARAIAAAVEPSLEGALAGALAGAVHGIEGLAPRTVDRLPRRDLIDAAAAARRGSPDTAQAAR